MSKRRQHAPEIKAKIVLATLKGEEATAELVRGTSVSGNACKACVTGDDDPSMEAVVARSRLRCDRALSGPATCAV